MKQTERALDGPVSEIEVYWKLMLQVVLGKLIIYTAL